MKQFLIIFFVSVTILFSNQDSVKSKWDYKGVTGLSINQVALSNWTQGGDNAIAWTLQGNFGANYTGEKWTFRNDLKLSFGMTKLGSDEFKTNDNEIYNETVLSYLIGFKLNPFFSNSIRTVISKGYDYKKKDRPQIAEFFDPGYIVQSLGYEYMPVKNFSTRLGIAIQEVFTNKFTYYTDDPKTPEVEKFKLETGVESVSEANYLIMENINLNSKLRLFSRYKSLDVWDVRWDNTINAKVNKLISVNFNVLLVYQLDQSVKTQLKEALQISITYSLF